MGIRWTSKDKQNLQKKVRNYNAKIKRLEKKGIKEEYIPDKLNYKELQKSISSRQELQTHLDIIKTVTVRGSENIVSNNKGLKVPAYLKNMMKLKVQSINRERKKSRNYYEKLDVTDRGKKIGIEREKFPELNVNKIRNKKFNFEKMTTQSFSSFLNSTKFQFDMETEERKREYVANYMKAMYNNLSAEQFKKLSGVINQIDNNTIVEKYYTDLNLDIDFYYDETEQNAKFETMMDSWQGILNEQNAEGD